MSENVFVIAWDMTGLEAIIDFTDHEQNLTWAILEDKECPTELYHQINHLMMRARANPQRHYEIYTLRTIDLSKEDLIELFKEDSQQIVDIIRKKGNKLFSDRAKPGQIRIL